MTIPAGLGEAPFAVSPFGWGLRDLTVTVGRGRSRALTAAPRSRITSAQPRQE